jgi:3-hydroxyacyl-CoA dehydrogenase
VRASQAAVPGGDVFAQLKPGLRDRRHGQGLDLAVEAKELGLLRGRRGRLQRRHELLHVARRQARALAESGYRPPLPARQIQVAGDVGIATFKMMLVNMLEGRFISEHDYEIATRIATVLCGGESTAARWSTRTGCCGWSASTSSRWRRWKTQARIGHMLKTGKPLRN